MPIIECREWKLIIGIMTRLRKISWSWLLRTMRLHFIAAAFSDDENKIQIFLNLPQPQDHKPHKHHEILKDDHFYNVSLFSAERKRRELTFPRLGRGWRRSPPWTQGLPSLGRWATLWPFLWCCCHWWERSTAPWLACNTINVKICQYVCFLTL